MRLFIVRHGQTSWNVQNRAQGHTDIPLDEAGLEQARALAAGFQPDCDIKTVYSSDLRRASETARPLADRLGAVLTLRTDLRERCFGECEGMAFPEMQRRLETLAEEQNRRVEDVTPMGAETLEDVWVRVSRFVEELEQREENVVIVSHGGTGNLLVARLMNGTPDTAKCLSLANTAYTHLERRSNGIYKLVSYNVNSHLGRSTAFSGGLEGSTH
jgi:broad specificity phosphatase PhoE